MKDFIISVSKFVSKSLTCQFCNGKMYKHQYSNKRSNVIGAASGSGASGSGASGSGSNVNRANRVSDCEKQRKKSRIDADELLTQKPQQALADHRSKAKKQLRFDEIIVEDDDDDVRNNGALHDEGEFVLSDLDEEEMVALEGAMAITERAEAVRKALLAANQQQPTRCEILSNPQSPDSHKTLVYSQCEQPPQDIEMTNEEEDDDFGWEVYNIAGGGESENFPPFIKTTDLAINHFYPIVAIKKIVTSKDENAVSSFFKLNVFHFN